MKKEYAVMHEMKLDHKKLGPKFGKLMRQIEEHFEKNYDVIEKVFQNKDTYEFDLPYDKVILHKDDIRFRTIKIQKVKEYDEFKDVLDEARGEK